MPFSPTHPLFAQGIVAAERAQREGMPLSAETLNAMDPQLRLSDAHELLGDARFARALEEVGINHDPTTRITSEQLAAVRLYLADTSRTHAQKLRAAGITQAKWAGWMRQPQFKAYIAAGALDMMEAALPATHMAVVDKAGRGEQWAVLLQYQLTGFHDPNKQDDPRKIFEAIFEVLSDEGVDHRVLEKVARRIRELADPAAVARAPRPAMIVASEQKAS